jgi:hypothetical protein
MTREEYVKKIDEICKREFIPAVILIRDLGITHNTLMRLRKNPQSCSMKTMSKIKIFVDYWESKNMSAIH